MVRCGKDAFEPPQLFQLMLSSMPHEVADCAYKWLGVENEGTDE